MSTMQTLPLRQLLTSARHDAQYSGSHEMQRAVDSLVAVVEAILDEVQELRAWVQDVDQSVRSQEQEISDLSELSQRWP